MIASFLALLAGFSAKRESQEIADLRAANAAAVRSVSHYLGRVCEQGRRLAELEVENERLRAEVSALLYREPAYMMYSVPDWDGGHAQMMATLQSQAQSQGPSPPPVGSITEIDLHGMTIREVLEATADRVAIISDRGEWPAMAHYMADCTPRGGRSAALRGIYPNVIADSPQGNETDPA